MKKIYVFASMMLAVALNYSCAKMDSPAFPSQDTPTEEAEGTKYLINVGGETHEVMLIGTFNAEKGAKVDFYLEGDANDYYGIEIDGAMTATGTGEKVFAEGKTTTGIIKVYGNKGLTHLTVTNAYPTETTFKNEWMATLETLQFTNPFSKTIVLPETMTKLKNLFISDSEITTIDVSKFTTLESLSISSCKNFASIDVTNNKNLTDLRLVGDIQLKSKLKSIDVSKNTKLKTLFVNDNEIEKLDVTALTELTQLRANGNKLTEIDITKNTKLKKELSLDHNKFTIATLPTMPAEIEQYNYAPQADMEVAKSFKVGETIDLTAQLYAQGVAKNQATTEFKFYADGKQLENGVDYEKTEDAGLVYKFLKKNTKVVCKMTTEAFPDFKDENIFKTTEFDIVAAE
ncbi:hypothetical protein SAMN04487851_101244 [Prevotella sp. tc2-28]|uniref:leucine-rich repeat domain-containing protein n=1 Tax=Prevotella sp. tc2-28 TaxID=1761888 RepID=UPI00089C02C0|nr:leucine-rich repeat domain-containing protein [Prevotella sp. tc2-28]SDZ94938.1 hypothetical protein SAMN04487851_101244 [Prevotella sp. tc2-28]